MLRIFAFFILLFSVLFLPFWVSVIIGLAGMIYFSFFWESIFLFFISDLLYGIKEARFLNIFFISLIISFLTLIIIELLKKKMRISN